MAFPAITAGVHSRVTACNVSELSLTGMCVCVCVSSMETCVNWIPTSLSLQIKETGNEHAVAYLVFDKVNPMPRNQVLISNLKLQNGTEYHISITYTNVYMTVVFSYDGTSQSNTDSWDSNSITLFVGQPQTKLSIGGAPGDNTFFIGCISSLKIDEIDVPLSGLTALSAEEGGFAYNTSDAVEPYCDLCDLTSCPGNRSCVSDLYGGTACECPVGYVLDEMSDRCTPTEPPTLGLSTSATSAQSVYYIAGGAGGSILLIGLLILVIIVTVRVQHLKHDRRKRTYSVTTDDILPPQRVSKTKNDYVHVQPRRSTNDDDDDNLTYLGTTCRPKSHERGSSVSTFQEHADDADPEINEPLHLQRRKSTVSAESGIRTDTERSSLRGTSRMDDSGTDYTPRESESDDMTSSCFMEPVSSPVGIQLVDSSSSVMGVPIKVASPCVPLTPQERKVITPLRPNRILLAMSQDDHHDTDIETDDSSCNLPPIRQGCSLQRESDSDTSTKVSDRSTHKWYKSSTASDNERESERALKNRAYYPTSSEPLRYPPPPPHPKTAFGAAAPDYIPLPSFSARKSTSPVLYPRSPSRRLPPTTMSVDSPLRRNTRRYENYPLPYSVPPPSDSMQERDTRVMGYDNHRLQHQISDPRGHRGQQGRHVRILLQANINAVATDGRSQGSSSQGSNIDYARRILQANINAAVTDGRSQGSNSQGSSIDYARRMLQANINAAVTDGRSQGSSSQGSSIDLACLMLQANIHCVSNNQPQN